MTSTKRTFISYSHKDADLREALVEHLALLQREGSCLSRRIAPSGPAIDSTRSSPPDCAKPTSYCSS